MKSDVIIGNFARTVRSYGENYRQFFNKSATPKLHLLETHCVRKLRTFKRLGPYREDPVEHEHQVQKRERIKISNVRNYFQANQLADRRRSASSNPEVSQHMQVIENFKNRTVSEAYAQRKRAKTERKLAIKNERLNARNNA